MEETNKYSSEAMHIVKVLMTVIKISTPTTDIRGWTIGISGSNCPFKSGNYAYLYEHSVVSHAREVISYFVDNYDLIAYFPEEKSTDDNIRMTCIFIEHHRDSGI